MLDTFSNCLNQILSTLQLYSSYSGAGSAWRWLSGVLDFHTKGLLCLILLVVHVDVDFLAPGTLAGGKAQSDDIALPSTHLKTGPQAKLRHLSPHQFSSIQPLHFKRNDCANDAFFNWAFRGSLPWYDIFLNWFPGCVWCSQPNNTKHPWGNAEWNDNNGFVWNLTSE